MSEQAKVAAGRERLVEAMIDLSVVVGFHGIVVGELCAVARVSRRTFYNHFQDLLALYDAAYEQMDAELRHEVREAWQSADHDPRAVVVGLVSYACADPVRADALFVQSLAAAGPVTVRRQGTMAWCGALLAGARTVPERPVLSLPQEIASGGVWDVIRTHVSAGNLDELRGRAAELAAAAVGCTERTYPASRFAAV